jgi:hypothetical protein
MELDEREKQAVRELSNAVNTAIEQSPTVAVAIEYLRRIGFEPNLRLKLEISLQEIPGGEPEDEPAEPALELTDDDLRTLQRMKIKI